MFSTIVTASTLEDFLAPVSALVDECTVHLNETGLSITAVDPANVAMVDTGIHADAFESYEADGGRIGINLDQFEDVLGLADSGDLVHLELNEDTRKLDIRFGEVDYTQALIDPDAIRQEPDLPDLDVPAEVVLEGSKLDRGVTAADLCSDHILLATEALESFMIDAEGDTDDVQVTFPTDELIDARVTDDVSALFSLDYMTDIVGVIDDGAEVRLQVGAELPVRLEYEHSEGTASVTNVLSPRIAGE